jgi:hypothetical protein
LLHYGLQDPGPWADVQRHPEKLWRLILERVLDGFPTGQLDSVKKIAEHCDAKVAMLSYAFVLCVISYPPNAGLWPQPRDTKPECRISNKEFRMMKLTPPVVAFGVRHSLFDILRFAFELLGSLRRSYRLRF